MALVAPCWCGASYGSRPPPWGSSSPPTIYGFYKWVWIWMLATLVPRGPSSGHIHHIGTFGHARLLTRHNHFLYLSRDSRIPWSGLAFRPIVFLGFCPKTQKPTTQAGSTFGSIYMRHPRIIDRGRKSIFTPLKSSKIYQFLPKTQKPKTQNPKVTTQAKWDFFGFLPPLCVAPLLHFTRPIFHGTAVQSYSVF